jgi:hypothetical protein
MKNWFCPTHEVHRLPQKPARAAFSLHLRLGSEYEGRGPNAAPDLSLKYIALVV